MEVWNCGGRILWRIGWGFVIGWERVSLDGVLYHDGGPHHWWDIVLVEYCGGAVLWMVGFSGMEHCLEGHFGCRRLWW